MPNIIKNGKIASDTWLQVELAEGAPAAFPADGDLLVPLAIWTAHRAALGLRRERLGLVLEGSDDAAPIAQDLHRFDLIAIHFKQFTDGRGNSLARLLRERYGYGGELRATGDVIRENLFLLLRCGFNAFALKGAPDDAALTEAIGNLEDFSDGYQTSVERPQPLFRRRLLGSAA